MPVFFLFAANVHVLCTKLQVHISQRASHDQLHAENSYRNVCPGHTGQLSACLHLHPTAGYSPQKRHDHEEEGLFVYSVLKALRRSVFNQKHPVILDLQTFLFKELINVPMTALKFCKVLAD